MIDTYAHWYTDQTFFKWLRVMCSIQGRRHTYLWTVLHSLCTAIICTPYGKWFILYTTIQIQIFIKLCSLTTPAPPSSCSFTQLLPLKPILYLQFRPAPPTNTQAPPSNYSFAQLLPLTQPWWSWETGSNVTCTSTMNWKKKEVLQCTLKPQTCYTPGRGKIVPRNII